MLFDMDYFVGLLVGQNDGNVTIGNINALQNKQSITTDAVRYLGTKSQKIASLCFRT